MCGAGRDNRTEDMVEKLKADLACQIIFGFEVAVKGAAADIGCIDDILNADFFMLVLVSNLTKASIIACLVFFCLLSMVCNAPLPIMYIL